MFAYTMPISYNSVVKWVSLVGQPYFSQEKKNSYMCDAPAKHCTHLKQRFSGALYYVPHAFLQNSKLTQYRCYWEPFFFWFFFFL